MTFRLPAAFVIPALLVVQHTPLRAEDGARPPLTAEPAVRLAQKAPDADDDKEKDRKGKRPPGKGDDKGDKGDRGGRGEGRRGEDGAARKGAGGPPAGDKSGESGKGPDRGGRGEAQRQPKDVPQASEKANQQRQEAERNAAKQKQREEQQAREKAAAEKARQDTAKQKQREEQQAREKAAAEKARQDAAKQKQREEQQAKDKGKDKDKDKDKDKAASDKREADKALRLKKLQELQELQTKAGRDKRAPDEKARPGVFNSKQFEDLKGREKAAREKREADEKARQDALKQKQLQDLQAKDKAARDKREAEERARQEELKRRPSDAGRRDGRGASPFDRAKADEEFEKARERARREQGGRGSGRAGDAEPWRDEQARRFEALRQGRKTRKVGTRDVIVEDDKRVIVRDEKRTFIRHDESRRFSKVGREVRRERQRDGTVMIVTLGLGGALIYSLEDDDGRLLRRSRKGRDGRELVLIDNRRFYRDRPRVGFGAGPLYDSYVDLPPPVVRIPREKYIVEYDQASPEDIYDALSAPPVEPIERGYSLEEVRYSYPLLERMRRVDLDAITFAFGSWEVGPDQYPKLERIARAMERILSRAPDEVFLIEGHTDAVGSEIDNLSLSDRRAEEVAVILTEEFHIPAENLTTQGYGETYLKVPTEEPSRVNRRVSVRRITPLLARDGGDGPR